MNKKLFAEFFAREKPRNSATSHSSIGAKKEVTGFSLEEISKLMPEECFAFGLSEREFRLDNDGRVNFIGNPRYKKGIYYVDAKVMNLKEGPTEASNYIAYFQGADKVVIDRHGGPMGFHSNHDKVIILNRDHDPLAYAEREKHMH